MPWMCIFIETERRHLKARSSQVGFIGYPPSLAASSVPGLSEFKQHFPDRPQSLFLTNCSSDELKAA